MTPQSFRRRSQVSVWWCIPKGIAPHADRCIAGVSLLPAAVLHVLIADDFAFSNAGCRSNGFTIGREGRRTGLIPWLATAV